MKKSLKQRYLTSAFLLIAATAVVKVISAVYKIPLTAYIGAQGRGYFSIAYNFGMPVHALTMGAFPLALTKLVSTYDAKGDKLKIKALRKASKKLFFVIGAVGLLVMLLLAKPYCTIISSSPKSMYTILAFAPSIFFSCLCACHRSFAEGFLDMKATALSQLIEAVIKMVFGLLLARYSLSWFYEFYLENNTVLGVNMADEAQALSAIYPLTSAFAMLGVTLGSIVAYAFCSVYVNTKYNNFPSERADTRLAYNELLSFSAPLVGATVVQSISNFADTSSVQYFLSLCSKADLSSAYHYSGDDIYTYVFGIFATVLDFKNLIPSIVMVLGVTAVPTLSNAYESSAVRFSSLLTSIFKYACILSVIGGLVLALFSSEILSIFYLDSHSDIVENGSKILSLMGMTILPCALATTTVYSTQALGFAKSTIPCFAISCAVRLIINYFFVSNEKYNIIGAVISNFVGFLIIVIMNIVTIRKKTNAKINLFEVFAKPVFCGIVTYFSASYIKGLREYTIIQSMLIIVFCVFIYFLMLIITKTLDVKLAINPKKM